jgi:phosphocarrier protein HPr
VKRATVTVANRLGLHARAAARLVGLATRYQSRITLTRVDTGHQVDAKSIFGVLLLAATEGTQLTVTASGADEEDALEAIRRFIQQPSLADE